MSDFEKIAVLDGDGVGPEITAATVQLVEAAAAAHDLRVDLVPASVGWKAYNEEGTTLPDATVSILTECPGWIVGPTSAGEYPADDPIEGHPSGFLRRHFNLFANIRPVHAWPGLSAIVPTLNTTVIRENTEGFYPDRNLFWGYGEVMPTSDVALSLRVITKAACERFARASYDYARGLQPSRLVVVHKRTALPRTDGLFVGAFEELESKYPEVTVEYMRIDTFSSHLAREPERFPVVATTNLFGDVMSDQAAGLVGGVGLAPSLNAGADYAMAQAVHGTAEDIAGKNEANPTALMLSAGSLLEWLGRRQRQLGDDRHSERWESAGRLVADGVAAVLADGPRTRDLGGAAGTTEFASAVLSAIAKT